MSGMNQTRTMRTTRLSRAENEMPEPQCVLLQVKARLAPRRQSRLCVENQRGRREQVE